MGQLLDLFIKELTAQYPSVATAKPDPVGLRESVGPLVSDQIVELPKSAYAKIQKAIADLYRYGKSDEHKKWLIEEYRKQGDLAAIEIISASTKNNSVLMAYDFHYEPTTGRISLIEINTNASGFLFSDLIYKANGFAFDSGGAALDRLMTSFSKESQLQFGREPKNIAIIDEDVLKQKMYLEFLMYRDLFKSRGYGAEIFEFKDAPTNGEYDLIYNRYNDFNFSENRSSHLREAYLNNKACFSPQPKEYLLLAYKERLIHFDEKNISDTLIPTFLLDEKTNRDELWARRKNLFFKPRALYGAKATYKGSSISRKTFENLFAKDSPAYLAQEFRPAGEQNGFKFDLRFYVYEDQVQLGVARCYQGQVTNFHTSGGGFASVKLI